MVNRIENNIKQSSNYVEKAKENTAAAVTYQKKARKVRCTVFVQSLQTLENAFFNLYTVNISIICLTSSIILE